METKELNVWGWIAMHCHKLGWYSSANVAEFLEGVEKEMWGNQHRKGWEDKQIYFDIYMRSTSYPANFLVAVARYRNIKVGCFVSGYECNNCKLAKKQGPCNQRGSISHFWQYVLLQDSQEELDEELQKYMKECLDGIWLK